MSLQVIPLHRLQFYSPLYEGVAHLERDSLPGRLAGSLPNHAAPRPSTSSRSTDDVHYLSQHFEFSVPARANSPHPHSRSASLSRDYDESASTYKKEQGWSGEWSGAQRMDDVVKSLRGLRMK
jgi:hypothetical protein